MVVLQNANGPLVPFRHVASTARFTAPISRPYRKIPIQNDLHFVLRWGPAFRPPRR